MNIRILLLLTVVPLAILAFMYYQGEQKPVTNTAEGKLHSRDFNFLMKETASFRYNGSMIGPWCEYRNRLYLHDQVDQRTYIFSSTGVVIDTIGEKGSAPWQNQQVCQIHVTPSGIHYLDNGLMTVKELDLNGVPLYYKKQNEVFWDGLHLAEHNYLILNDESVSFGFYKWNGKNKSTLVRFDSLLDVSLKENLHIAFEGQMIQGAEFHYYVCSRTGSFISFNKSGTVIGAFSTIDKTEPPRIIERRYNNLTMFERQPDEIVNYAASSDGTDLFVLSTVAFENSDQMSIDRYGPDGAYKGSMRVPNHDNSLPVSIAASAGKIYVLYEDLQIITYHLLAVAI